VTHWSSVVDCVLLL